MSTASLQADLSGRVLVPTSPGYDDARAVFNGMVDRRPAAIAHCVSPEDVARTLRYARAEGLEIGVRGGGHSVAGLALTDGVVIDLREMQGVSVDRDAMTATVAGGAQMRHLDRATEPYGLATTGGRVSTTGVGGFTLGGGTGWLDRTFGLACDNLLSVDLVTSDGEQVRASETENPELFWALHGGGGNFGVATALTFRLHEVPMMTAALLMWHPDHGREVVPAYRDFLESAPDEVGGALIYLTGPEESFVPGALVGQLTCAVLLTYTGPEQQARQAWAPMLRLGHRGEMLRELSYADLQCMLDDPPGFRNYWTAEYVSSFPDEATQRFCALAPEMVVPSPSQHVLFPQGGFAGRGPVDYPIPWRHAPWVIHPFAVWTDPSDDDRARAWARSVRTEMLPWSIGAVYLNFIGDEGHDRVMAGYGELNWARLQAVKAKYDPDNVFHRNHNILPA